MMTLITQRPIGSSPARAPPFAAAGRGLPNELSPILARPSPAFISEPARLPLAELSSGERNRRYGFDLVFALAAVDAAAPT